MKNISQLNFNDMPSSKNDSVFVTLQDLLDSNNIDLSPDKNLSNFLPNDDMIEYSNAKPEIPRIIMNKPLPPLSTLQFNSQMPTIKAMPKLIEEDIFQPVKKSNSLFGDMFKSYSGIDMDIEKSIELTSKAQMDTLKIFFGSFVILYLLYPGMSFLHIKCEKTNKKRPNYLLIIILSIIISIAYFAASCIEILDQLQK